MILPYSKWGLTSALSIQIAISSFNYSNHFIGFFDNSSDVVIKG